MDNRHVAVGIDLGTTNSSIAIYFPNGTVQVVTDREGKRQFVPSYVYFPQRNNKILVGAAAAAFKRDGATTLGTVVFDTKRLLGQPYSEIAESPVQKWQSVVNVPVRNVGGRPIIECQFNGQLELQRPEDIAAKILKKLIENAEQQLNTRSSDRPIRLTQAVICVPAHFNSGQKEQTKEAAIRAGLTDVKFLPEPTAAVYSYGFRERDYDNVNILVYDFGGGTFDVSIMSIKDRVFKVIEKDGLMHLGGRDLDKELFDHCARLIQERFGIDCRTKKSWAHSLRNQCEEAKELLSETDEISIYLNFLSIDEELIVTVEEYEELIQPKIAQTIRVTMGTLARAGLEIEQINEVLLVGGSSRIPLVEKMLKAQGFAHLNKSEDPEVSIAQGAAVFAGMSFGEMKSQMPKMKLIETTPLSLGVRSDFNQFSKIIERNTQIPCKKTRIYSTSINDQQSMRFELFEGERPIASLNNFIGTLIIDEIGAGVAGSKNVHLTIEVDKDGMLGAFAKHGDVETKMDFKYEPQAELGEQQLEEMIRQATQNAEQDRAELMRMQAKSNLQIQIEQKKYKCVTPKILDLCEEFTLWLEGNEDAEIEILQQKLEQFKRETQ